VRQRGPCGGERRSACKVPLLEPLKQPLVAQPSASGEEAAAIVAAVERFMHDTAPRLAAAAPAQQNAWHAAAILEGASRDPWALAPDAWLGPVA